MSGKFTNSTAPKYSVGSLFAGVGGMCHAFKNTSCDVLWANEIDAKACQTYRLNNDSTQLIEGDIKNLPVASLQDIDILTAGFPCQPFSQAGYGKGFADDRGKLFFKVPKLLKALEPKAYLLENVRTLTTHNSGKSFRTVQKAMLAAGYSFIPFILNAAQYTDIPQGRERVYIVGFKDEAAYFYDTPIKINNNDIKNCPMSQSFALPKETKGSLRDIKKFLETASDEYIYNDSNNIIHKRIMDKVKRDDTFYQYRRYYVRENKSNVCPTLTASMGGGGHNVPIVLDGKYPRKLTPKECFNLQGFSKKFKLPDNIPNGQLYKQAGNAVVVPLVEKIASEMIRVLNENRYSFA